MTFLPIVERELRVASRRRATYWMRFWLALGAVVFWFLLMATNRRLSNAELGPMLFVATGVIALGFCMFAGVFLTADCLSEEKREGTIGLLFLTELRGYDVVLGKLIATSLHAFYGIVAITPMLALPLLLGGVTVGEFWRVALVLLITLLWSLATGMLVSALSQETRQAMVLTFGVVVVAAGLLPVLWWLNGVVMRGRGWNGLLWASPPYLYTRALESFFARGSGPGQFWEALLTVLIPGTGALALAAFYLPRLWSTDTPSGRSTRKMNGNGWRERWRFGSFRFREQRKRWLQSHPYYWLTSRERAPHRIAWIIVGSLFAIWVCFFVGCFQGSGRVGTTSFMVTMFLAYGSHQVLKWLIAIEASRRVSEDRQSGALELLLVTPISPIQVFDGHWRALRERFTGPMLLTLAMNAGLFWFTYAPHRGRVATGDKSVFGEIYLGGAFMMVVDFYAMGWIGMWMAFQTKKHHRAVLATLARVMLAPWVAVLLFVFMTISGGVRSADAAMVLIAFWFGLATAIELGFVMKAKEGLAAGLRR